jgi:hypothetical protein
MFQTGPTDRQKNQTLKAASLAETATIGKRLGRSGAVSNAGRQLFIQLR